MSDKSDNILGLLLNTIAFAPQLLFTSKFTAKTNNTKAKKKKKTVYKYDYLSLMIALEPPLMRIMLNQICSDKA